MLVERLYDPDEQARDGGRGLSGAEEEGYGWVRVGARWPVPERRERENAADVLELEDARANVN